MIPAKEFERLADGFVQRVSAETKKLVTAYGLKDGSVGRLLIISLASPPGTLVRDVAATILRTFSG